MEQDCVESTRTIAPGWSPSCSSSETQGLQLQGAKAQGYGVEEEAGQGEAEDTLVLWPALYLRGGEPWASPFCSLSGHDLTIF